MADDIGEEAERCVAHNAARERTKTDRIKRLRGRVERAKAYSLEGGGLHDAVLGILDLLADEL